MVRSMLHICSRGFYFSRTQHIRANKIGLFFSTANLRDMDFKSR